MNNHTNVNLRDLFKGNWERFKSLNKNDSDLRAKFEALYNCFENVGQLTTSQVNSRMIDSLKEESETNILRKTFIFLYEKPNKEKSLLFYLKKLRGLQPIYNNTRDQSVFLTKETPFETFLDALYVIRNNVRHGVKEYVDRSDEILLSTVGVLEVLISETYNKVFEKELLEIKRIKEETDKRKRKNEDSFNTFKTILSFIAFLLLIPFIGFLMSLFSGNSERDCVPMYDQTPTQEQIGAYNHGVSVGVSGGYVQSRKVGCAP